jgi:hypothetical protein
MEGNLGQGLSPIALALKIGNAGVIVTGIT